MQTSRSGCWPRTARLLGLCNCARSCCVLPPPPILIGGGWGTHAVQRSGRIDSGKALVVARKFSNGKLASKALTGAEFLPLSSSFQEIWRQQRLEERYDRAAGFHLSPFPDQLGEDMEGGTHAVQRSGRIDSGKALAVTRKFSNGKLASKALTGANFLPLSSSFQEIWRQQRLEERYDRAAGFQM